MLLFSTRQRNEREAAARIYAACLAAARRPALYVDLGVPDTLQGRFEMVALMLFPVLNRLMHQPGDDPELARHVSERFVDDMDAAFREMGVSDPAMPKRMKKLYSSFAGRISAYREALDSRERLADAVARNIFPDASSDPHSRSLADYLHDATAAIATSDLGALRNGDVPFPPLSLAGSGGEAA